MLFEIKEIHTPVDRNGKCFDWVFEGCNDHPSKGNQIHQAAKMPLTRWV